LALALGCAQLEREAPVYVSIGWRNAGTTPISDVMIEYGGPTLRFTHRTVPGGGSGGGARAPGSSLDDRVLDSYPLYP
jgi:hypothetical protein